MNPHSHKKACQQQPEEPRVGRITIVSVLVWAAVIGIAMLNQYLAL